MTDTLNSLEGSKLEAERSGGMTAHTRVAAIGGDEKWSDLAYILKGKPT